MFEHGPCFPKAQEMTSLARPADGPLQVVRSLTHAKWAARAETHTHKTRLPEACHPTMHLCLQQSHLSVFNKLRWRQETWARLRNRGPLWSFLSRGVEWSGDPWPVNVRFTDETSWGSRWKWIASWIIAASASSCAAFYYKPRDPI